MKTILITGIGGLTPRSIAKHIRKKHPNYRLIGCDINKKAMGFFMEGLLDEHVVCPPCNSPEYFLWVERLVEEKGIDYAFVQPESEIVMWADYAAYFLRRCGIKAKSEAVVIYPNPGIPAKLIVWGMEVMTEKYSRAMR